MKIRPKILIAFAVPTIVMLIVGAVNLRALNRGLATTNKVRFTEQVIASADELLKSVIDAETGERGFVITRAETFLAPFSDGNTTFQLTAAQLKVLVSANPPQVARVDQMIQLHLQWLDQVATPVIAAVRAGGFDTAAKLESSGIGKSLVDQLRVVAADFVGTEQKLLQTRTATSDSATRSARTVLLAGLGLILLLEVGLGFGLSQMISSSIETVTGAARALAGGDTTARAVVRSRDEVGDLAGAFNAMAERLVQAAETERDSAEAERDSKTRLQDAVRDYSEFAAKVSGGDLTATVAVNGSQDLAVLSGNLNNMVRGLADISGQVRRGVEGMRTSTSEILSAVSLHTASASQQSAAINETSTTADELRAGSEQTASQARELAQQATDSLQVSDQGTKAVETIAKAMEEIRERMEAIAGDTLILSEQTQQIGEITATVNDLADQSNILALNASIEAAKAGEHGKGFAVVATEVRNLAEQSKGATAQVRRILGDIQKATTAAVLATEKGTKVVEKGLELSGLAAEGIRSLAETIRVADRAAQQIAASAHQQSVGMDQIAHAMKDVNDGTTQFVAGARQSQQAAQDLNELSRQLAALTEQYRV